MVSILIAPDKFKGSLTAKEVCEIVRNALLKKNSALNIITLPLADGGEGTLELFTELEGGKIVLKQVNDPLFAPIIASYGISEGGSTAFIEMAKASGLQLLLPEKRDPLKTSTYGTGELIRDALDRGVKRIILGIGGSATNDAGLGMAAALGFQLLDSSGNVLKPIGENLIHLSSIKTDSVNPRLKAVECITLCDVNNPLYGQAGAAYVYALQKGARQEDLMLLDSGLRNFEAVVERTFNASPSFPGAGAAGGLGAGAKVFLNARLQTGIDYIIHATGLEQKIKDVDIVITGEGKLDFQSLSGKVVMAISKIAQHHHKPAIAICGKSDLTPDTLKRSGLAKVLALTDDGTTSADAMLHAHPLLEKLVQVNYDTIINAKIMA
jgi:glycerate kinase